MASFYRAWTSYPLDDCDGQMLIELLDLGDNIRRNDVGELNYSATKDKTIYIGIDTSYGSIPFSFDLNVVETEFANLKALASTPIREN